MFAHTLALPEPFWRVAVEFTICTMATLRFTLRPYTLTKPRQPTKAIM